MQISNVDGMIAAIFDAGKDVEGNSEKVIELFKAMLDEKTSSPSLIDRAKKMGINDSELLNSISELFLTAKIDPEIRNKLEAHLVCDSLRTLTIASILPTNETLLKAAANGEIETFQALVERGADPDFVLSYLLKYDKEDPRKEAPKTSVCEKLIELGAIPTIQMFLDSIHYNRYQHVRLLLEKTKLSNDDLRIIFCAAAIKGKISVLNEFIKELDRRQNPVFKQSLLNSALFQTLSYIEDSKIDKTYEAALNLLDLGAVCDVYILITLAESINETQNKTLESLFNELLKGHEQRIEKEIKEYLLKKVALENDFRVFVNISDFEHNGPYCKTLKTLIRLGCGSIAIREIVKENKFYLEPINQLASVFLQFYLALHFTQSNCDIALLTQTAHAVLPAVFDSLFKRETPLNDSEKHFLTMSKKYWIYLYLEDEVIELLKNYGEKTECWIEHIQGSSKLKKSKV